MNLSLRIKSGWAASCVAVMALSIPVAGHATQLMKATVTGTVASGGDAYSNTVYFGPPVNPNLGGNLVGQAVSVSIVYDADRFRPNYPGYEPNWYFNHQPGYPAFLGTAGQSPVLSGSFTVNGYTIPMDVSGLYEVARLSALNPVFDPNWGQGDSWILTGGDSRFTWCPNDGQCSETIQLAASQSYTPNDLYGGQHNFDPADSFTAQVIPYRSISAYVRMMSVATCPSGMCAPERFGDNAVHWVEFYVNGTSLTVAPLTAPVPEPETYALMLAGLGMVGFMSRRCLS